MQTFKHGDLIKIAGKKWMHYGKVGTLRHAYERSDYFKTNWPDYGDFLTEMYRRQDGDTYQAYATQDALVICADPGYYDRRRAHEANCREVHDGEIVTIDNEPLRVRFVGDYASIIHFYPA